MLVLNTARDSAPITSLRETHPGRPVLLDSCDPVLNFEAKCFTDIVWKSSAGTMKSKLTCVFSRLDGYRVGGFSPVCSVG